MSRLPESLVAMVRERIADPHRRHHGGDSQHHGATSDPAEVERFLSGGKLPDDGTTPDAWAMVVRQMQAWGQSMPEMHLSTDTQGNRRASSDSGQYELAPPASDADIRQLEARICRPLPDDLRQLFGIANGGWGPGYSFTIGHGPGLHSVAGVIAELDDLGRRGPGYTGEIEWPANLLPLTDNMGMASYDLDTGAIVQWDEHWYDHDKTIEEAFAVSHPNLQDFLQEWLLD